MEKDGPRLLIPESPGLGVEFDEERATREQFELTPTVHLRRRDGSITNS